MLIYPLLPHVQAASRALHATLGAMQPAANCNLQAAILHCKHTVLQTTMRTTSSCCCLTCVRQHLKLHGVSTRGHMYSHGWHCGARWAVHLHVTQPCNCVQWRVPLMLLVQGSQTPHLLRVCNLSARNGCHHVHPMAIR